jgi:hypothetical protein
MRPLGGCGSRKERGQPFNRLKTVTASTKPCSQTTEPFQWVKVLPGKKVIGVCHKVGEKIRVVNG